MSAFVVSGKHLNVIINAYRDYDQYHFLKEGVEEEIIKILHKEDVKSIRYRYPNDKFCYRTPFFRKIAIAQTPVEIIKLCDCYNYQACETETYKESEAAKIIEQIRNSAIRQLNGY